MICVRFVLVVVIGKREACGMKEQDTTSVVRTYSTRMEAEFGRMTLEASGIYSFINGDDAGGLQPFLAINGVQLIVRKDELERADDVLQESDAKDSLQSSGG